MIPPRDILDEAHDETLILGTVDNMCRDGVMTESLHRFESSLAANQVKHSRIVGARPTAYGYRFL